ncbi:MAG: NAD(P)-dependent alcohol dehydrogenase [Gammaproteobacteria bacterium]|nr:NAD(P)-dependent alcohol dehydrogenase [Gammaproteobacteria bacterium]
MKVARVRNPAALSTLEVVDVPDPTPGPGEICVRVRASSLNYHDYAVVSGMLPVADGRIPMSDGAGDVVAVGAGVLRFQVGDKVMSTFFPHWPGGEVSAERARGVPGDHVDGFAAEYVVMPASAFTRMPTGYSYEQAATLPCAALTAWRALFVENATKPGDWVLTQGTGGVSVFALQFAKAAGARVISTSSSAAKLERLATLGADHLVNYKETPDWGVKARELTGGRGVDVVVEIGGAGTLAQSIEATRVGGHISLIGVLAGWSGEVPTAAVMWKNIAVKGITVGSIEDQEAMVAAIEANGIVPVIDRSFALAEIAQAFEHQAAQRHFGKICLSF